jgi:tetratricopeptide (TPR) repeat protein
MANKRTSLLFSSCVSGLVCCLAASLSFADVPRHERQSVAPPPIDNLLGVDRGANRAQEVEKIEQTCFTGESPSGAPRSNSADNEREGPELTTLFCARLVGLVANADELGWSGYEANGDHAKSVGNWPEAEKAYATAVGLLDRTPDKDTNQDLAALLNKLGVTRFKQNDFAGAETVFRRALVIYTVTRGAEDLHVADTLDLVAGSLFQQQQGRVLAGPLFYRAWAIREKALAPDHPAIAESLQHVAVSLYSDNLALAIPLFVRSKEIREKVFGRDHPLVANSLNAMARLYEAHDRRDLAIPLYQEALTIQEKVFGANASETIQARDDLDLSHREDDLREDPN